MEHYNETLGGKLFVYMTQIFCLGLDWIKTLSSIRLFNRMLCLVCVIIVRLLFGVSLNGQVNSHGTDEQRISKPRLNRDSLHEKLNLLSNAK